MMPPRVLASGPKPCKKIHEKKYTKKFLDSDWLRAVQFKCNTSAKSVTSVQKVQHQCKSHIVILDFDWLKDNRKFSKPMILRKMMMKMLCPNFEQSFLE